MGGVERLLVGPRERLLVGSGERLVVVEEPLERLLVAPTANTRAPIFLVGPRAPVLTKEGQCSV